MEIGQVAEGRREEAMLTRYAAEDCAANDAPLCRRAPRIEANKALHARARRGFPARGANPRFTKQHASPPPATSFAIPSGDSCSRNIGLCGVWGPSHHELQRWCFREVPCLIVLMV
jgi:hypothetical protein